MWRWRLLRVKLSSFFWFGASIMMRDLSEYLSILIMCCEVLFIQAWRLSPMSAAEWNCGSWRSCVSNGYRHKNVIETGETGWSYRLCESIMEWLCVASRSPLLLDWLALNSIFLCALIVANMCIETRDGSVGGIEVVTLLETRADHAFLVLVANEKTRIFVDHSELFKFIFPYSL